MKPVNTVFIGSSYEGIEILKTLHQSNKYNVKGIITQPDKPAGREQVLKPTDIKLIAQELNIPVYEPNSDVKKYVQILDKTKPKLIICIAFGEFIPKEVLDYPKYKCLNIHFSLLPELRGACPVQGAILEGLNKTGVTIQVMEEKMDVGPIIAQREVEISADETTETLKQKLIPISHDLLMMTLPDWIECKINPVTQDESKATYCYIKDISKEAAKIDWDTESPEEIERKIRALSTWPVAWTDLEDKRLKIFQASIIKNNTNEKPGVLISIDDKPAFSTKDPAKQILLEQVQLEGKIQMDGKTFMTGYRQKRTK